MFAAIFTLWSALSPLAAAAPAGHEVSLEMGTTGVMDPSWAVFSANPTLGSGGFRGGVAVAPWTRIIAGWQHGTNGREISIEDGTSGIEVASLHTAATIDQYSVGAKFVWEAKPWIHPYATTQGVLFVGHVRLDDDIRLKGNDNELRFSAVAPGLISTLGAEVLALGKDKPVRLAFSLEFGYGHAWPMRFKDKTQDVPTDLGDVIVSGFVSRVGAGIRF
jgi:hypothetical protein